MKLDIKCRFNGNVLFSHECERNTTKITVEAAAKVVADLSGADLSGANLSDADLSGAYLSDADLSGADLSGANLSDADLSGADLSGADLSGADLRGANLRGANLRGATLENGTLTKPPISILNLHWDVLITEKYMRIGCKRYTHEEWASFTDDEISKMDQNALNFWKQWKTALMGICKEHGNA